MDDPPADEHAARRAVDTDAVSSRRFLVALALLAAVFAFGAWVERDPDFDVTSGIEAWRRFGPVAALVVAAALGVLCANRRAAEGVASAAAAAVRAVPRPARVPLLLAAALALFIAFPDVSLSGDATIGIDFAIQRQTSPSNALTNWLDIASSDVLGAFGLDPVVAVRAVSWAAGLVGAACAVALARSLYSDGPRRAATAFLLLTTGHAALYFGSLEFYAPLGAAVLAYLLVSVRAMRGDGSPLLPPLVLGVAFALHGSAGLLLLSLALFAWDPFGGRGRDLRGAIRRVATAGALFLVPVAATFACLYFGTWHGTPPTRGPLRFGNFFGAQGIGPVVAPRLGPADVGARFALLDAEHALAVLGTIFVAAPAAWASLAANVRGRRDVAPAPPIDRRLVGFAVAALVPWLAYVCFWNVSFSFRRDWDMFSPLGSLAALAAAVVVLRGRDDRARAVRTAALCLFAFAPFVASHAGDFKARRAFAITVSAAIVRSDAAGRDDVRAAWAHRWDEESHRLDLTGALARIEEGDALAAKGLYAEALAKYDEALAAEPDNVAARYCRGAQLVLLGRREEARREMNETLRLAATTENVRLLARHELGRLAAEDGDLSEAVRQLSRALRECCYGPDSTSVANDLAALWRRRGREDYAASIERWAAVWANR